MTNSRYRIALHDLRQWRPTPGIECMDLDPSSARVRMPWTVPTGAVAVIAALVVALSLPARAVSLVDLAEALQNAKAVHVSRYLVDNDKPAEPYMQEWREGAKYRYSGGLDGRFPQTSQGHDGKRGWSVSFEDMAVNIGIDLMKREPKPLETIDTMVAEFRKSARDGAGVTRRQEGKVEIVTFEGKERSNGYRFRYEVSAERSTGLPIEQRRYNLASSGKWVLRGLVKFEYPSDIPDAVFAPQVPDGFAVYDYDKVVSDMSRAFTNGESKTVHSVTVTLLGALQEQDGTVYLLWKGGAAPPLFASVAVHAADGTQHAAEFFYEADDRSRPRNYGVAPKKPKPPVAREDLLIKLGPLGWHKGEPFYCLRFNPRRMKPNSAQTYRVVLPVCEKVGAYVQQPNGWVRHQAVGKEVGAATFDVTTTPIQQWWWVFEKLDPDKMFGYGLYPATNIGMTKEQVSAYKREQFARMEREMMENRTVRVFGGQ